MIIRMWDNMGKTIIYPKSPLLQAGLRPFPVMGSLCHCFPTLPSGNSTWSWNVLNMAVEIVSSPNQPEDFPISDVNVYQVGYSKSPLKSFPESSAVRSWSNYASVPCMGRSSMPHLASHLDWMCWKWGFLKMMVAPNSWMVHTLR